MIKSSWYALPAAFFLLLNLALSPVEVLFVNRLIYILFFVALFLFLRRFDLSDILRVTVGGVSLIIFSYGLAQKLIIFPHYLKTIQPESNYYAHALLTRIKSGRIFSLFSLPTLYAIICAVLLLFILYYFLNAKRRVFWGFLLALGVVNLLLTQSFGGLIYLSVGVLIYLVKSGILKFKFFAPMVMILSLFFFIVVGLRFAEVKRLEPLMLRISNWEQAVRVVGTNPLWGVGLGNYEAQVSYHIRPGEARSIYAHNFFLQFLAESGFVFPLIGLLILWLNRRALVPPPGENRNLYIAALVILLFYNLVDIGFYFFSAALAGIVILSQLYRRSDRGGLKPSSWLTPGLLSLALGVLMLLQSVSSGHQQRGHFSLSQEEIADARAHYGRSLGYYPLNYRSLVGLGHLEFKEGHWQRSSDYLQRALHLYPNLAYPNYLLSQIRHKQDRFLQAFHHARLAYRKQETTKIYRDWFGFVEKNIQSGISSGGPSDAREE